MTVKSQSQALGVNSQLPSESADIHIGISELRYFVTIGSAMSVYVCRLMASLNFFDLWLSYPLNKVNDLLNKGLYAVESYKQWMIYGVSAATSH